MVIIFARAHTACRDARVMNSMTSEFSRLKSVEVVVEERRVALQVTPHTWRTHMFTGLETIPDALKPAFAGEDGSGKHDLNLLELVRKSYRGGRIETRFEAPYRLGDSNKSPTVLRSVVITMRYQRHERVGNAAALLAPSRAVGMAMPMVAKVGAWPTVEVRKAEQEVRRCCRRVSQSLIELAVRLVKLDMRPKEGTRKLAREAVALIEGRLVRSSAA